MRIKKAMITVMGILTITTGAAFYYVVNDTYNTMTAKNLAPEQDGIQKLSAKLEQLKLHLNSSTENSDADKAVQTSNTNDEVAREVDALAKQLDDLREEMHALLSEKTQENSPAVEEMSQQQIDAAIEQKQAMTTDLYTDAMQTEDIDADWSYQAEKKTRDALAAVSDKLITHEIECRTSLCRLDIGKAEGATNDEALDAFDTSIEWRGEMRMTYDPNTGEGVVYMAREGHSLPRLVN